MPLNSPFDGIQKGLINFEIKPNKRGKYAMSHQNIIESLIRKGAVESVLKRGSKAKKEIVSLQTLLNELGFGSQLNWAKYGPDGEYGNSTAAAVALFGRKNHLESDGSTVTNQIAKAILARYDILDDLRYLHNLVERGKVSKRIYYGSLDRVGVTSLQTLLYELGFGTELNWEKYGADGQYGKGTAKALTAFAKKEGLVADGNRLDRNMANCMLQKFTDFLGDDWTIKSVPASEPATITGNLALREVMEKNRPRLYISDGTVEGRFTRFKKGVYLYGKQRPLEFIKNNKSTLTELGLTDSAINVMVAVSENEGNLDAVNTWDNSFMTFGMFQWTLGAGGNKGELPALLKKIKALNPSVFEQYYGQFGLDVTETNDRYGYFLLNGKKIANNSSKETLRSNQWAFNFWKSGLDPLVQSVQIQHASSRLKTFYRSKQYKIDSYFIADLITSEYGMGLVLDNHVNRPGYVAPCLKAAMDQAHLSNPAEWSTREELLLIDTYLKVRNSYGKYPMTDAAKRAAVTKKYLKNGIISAERGSFQQPLQGTG
jgi:peptidoglycan hydrolase-like protein with peptidoglycan-binding domain